MLWDLQIPGILILLIVEIILKTEFLAFFAIFSVLLFFWLYFFTAKRRLLLKYFIQPVFHSWSAGAKEFISYKLTGILFTGVLPFLVFVLILKVPLSGTGLVIGRTFHFWYLLFILIIITALVSFKMSQSIKVQHMSPELKLRDWFPRHVVLSVAAWLLYILGYEFLFRGVLWFLSSEAFGFWPALFINLLLYSIVHIPQGKYVTLGTIPVGAVLCLLSQLTGSFIPAFLIHSLIAVLTDLFTLYHNTEIRLHLSDTDK